MIIKRIYRWLVLMVVIFTSSPLFAQQVDVPERYGTIQEAINAIVADPNLGNTVFIAPGTYEENIEIGAGIILRGEETARTILKAVTETQPVISITNTSNVTVRNLTFDSGDIALSVDNALNVTIKNNVFALHDQAIAIRFDLPSRADVEHNVFYDNDTAIVRESEQIVVRNNIFTKNRLAISGGGGQVDYNCFYDNDLLGVTGQNAVIDEDPLFVDTTKLDFHLQESSPCIDVGDGIDVVDDSEADMGAYGGSLADVIPFPVQGVVVTNVSSTRGSPSIQVAWQRNKSYLVTHQATPGGYLLYYDSDLAGPPYSGKDAAGGATHSPIDVGDVETYTLSDLAVDSAIPVTPEITNLRPANGRVAITWSAVSGATSYQLHYGVSSVNENVIVVGKALSYTVENLINGTSYMFAVSAKAQAEYFIALKAYDSTDEANESDYSADVSIKMGEERTSERSLTLTAIPELIVPVPDLPNEGCFIATAAFGYYSAPEVQWLREFRDLYLKRYAVGRLFIEVYYEVSPTLAHYVRQSELLKQLVRLCLTPLIIISGLLVHWQITLFTTLTLVLLSCFVHMPRLRKGLMR